MPKRQEERGGSRPARRRSLDELGALATTAIRDLFPECGPVLVFRRSDGALGFRLDVHVTSGERAKLDEAYRIVTRLLGERRGRPSGRKTVQTKLLLPADTYAALKASARRSRRTMSGVAAEAIRSELEGKAPERGGTRSRTLRGGDKVEGPVNLEDVLVFLRETPLLVRQAADGLTPADRTWRPSAREFSLLEHACHLRDIEREGFDVRITRLLSEPNPDLPDLDGDLLARERRYNHQDLATAVAAFERARFETLRKLTGLTAEQLGRTGELEGVGRISVAELALVMRNHDAEHRKEIVSLRDRLLESSALGRDRAAILKAVEEFVDAFRVGDVDRLASAYAEDLVKLRAGAAPETKSDVRQRLTATFARFVCDLEVTNEEVLIDGGLAVVRGLYRVTRAPKDGGPSEADERRFVEVWRRDEGRWLVARTMDSAA